MKACCKTARSGARVPGAQPWTCRWKITGAEFILIFFCIFPGLAAGDAETDGGAEKFGALVKEAGRPEIFYADPVRRDSLVALLATGAGKDPQSLVGLLDTPWALHFEVVRRALEKLGEPAAAAIRDRLARGGGDLPLPVLLAAFENLARPGDEEVLGRAAEGEAPEPKVLASRCLAAFGRGRRAISLLLPWLGDRVPGVRLAALRAVAEVWERGPVEETADTLVMMIEPLCDDFFPLVRLTAAETLGIIRPGDGYISESLDPER
ncbi:MAG: HEAT repeat domain-containing protein [Candidatus Glassbacteria bacterium]|nr:HEAT repeat domain-containing protein [Candidatus Glassbacteria bacterium]